MDMIRQVRTLLFIRGAISLIFGLIVLFNPALSLDILVLFFGAYIFVMGLSNLIYALVNRHARPDWTMILFEGIVGMLVGLLIWAWPGITVLILLYIIAAWAIFLGLVQLIMAVKYSNVLILAFILGLVGILSILFGLYVVVYPAIAEVIIAMLVGVYAVVFGVAFIFMGMAAKPNN